MVVLLAHPSVVGIPPGLSNEEIGRRAEDEFARGVRLRKDANRAGPHFQSAAQHFEELRQRGVSNPYLFGNLGNAYLLAGDLPHAILTYRRGLRAAPGNEALRQNLAEARAMVAYPGQAGLGMPAPEKADHWLAMLGPKVAWAAAAFLYGIGCLLLTRWWISSGRRSLTFGSIALVAAASLSAYGFFIHRPESKLPLVVVAEDGLLLRKGDGPLYPPRYETQLNRGVEARILFDRGDWIQIELAGGEVGWVPRKSVLFDDEIP
jgi:hypothetical protein